MTKPTIVLVAGAFAESSSWNDVVAPLLADGYPVIAQACALRGLASDARDASDLVRSVEGPVVLVGHSYGGAVITNVAADAGEIIGMVYVAGFALQPEETCAAATALAPGGTLAETLGTVALSDGGVDLYIRQDRYHEQFAADLPREQTALMAATQRPVTEAALNEPSSDAPLWRTLPSWFVFGDQDRNIPVGSHRAMAERAGSRRTLEIAGASHVVGMSHPAETTAMIVEAARADTLISS